jgi:immune inhibitor A
LYKRVLLGAAYEADGAIIYVYLIVPEDAKIGVCCHELGHPLVGVPDMYETDYSSEGVGNWCLMGGGSWLGGGEVPAHPSAWCKLQQGWVQVDEPGTAPGLQIEDVKRSKRILRLWKSGAAGEEYFLVENRQKSEYDRELPGEGLLVWHVDDSIPGNSNEIHPKVALVQADGRQDLENGNNRGDDRDPYPGSSGNLKFTADSVPSSKSYGDRDSCVSLENIGPAGPIMTADVSTVCAADGLSWWQRLLQFLSSLFDS